MRSRRPLWRRMGRKLNTLVCFTLNVTERVCCLFLSAHIMAFVQNDPSLSVLYYFQPYGSVPQTQTFYVVLIRVVQTTLTKHQTSLGLCAKYFTNSLFLTDYIERLLCQLGQMAKNPKHFGHCLGHYIIVNRQNTQSSFLLLVKQHCCHDLSHLNA